MSYEGHSQCICEKGHYFIKDCYDSDELCPYSTCKAPIAMENMVDDTNGKSYGKILGKDLIKFLVHHQENCTCECGNVHLRTAAIYRIPTHEESQALRTIDYGDGPIYLKNLKND